MCITYIRFIKTSILIKLCVCGWKYGRLLDDSYRVVEYMTKKKT